MKYGAMRKNTITETVSDGYLCPKCKKLVSYVPVRRLRRCVYCNQELFWGPEKDKEAD
jgi:DNA-directed RNA polymerase subunit RPC12/RpoP